MKMCKALCSPLCKLQELQYVLSTQKYCSFWVFFFRQTWVTFKVEKWFCLLKASNTASWLQDPWRLYQQLWFLGSQSWKKWTWHITMLVSAEWRLFANPCTTHFAHCGASCKCVFEMIKQLSMPFTLISCNSEWNIENVSDESELLFKFFCQLLFWCIFYFSFYGCELTGECCHHFMEALMSENCLLAELDLSVNNLGQEGGLLLCQALSRPGCRMETLW